MVYVLGQAHWLNVSVTLETPRSAPRSTCHHSLSRKAELHRVEELPSFAISGTNQAPFSELEALAGLPLASSTVPDGAGVVVVGGGVVVVGGGVVVVGGGVVVVGGGVVVEALVPKTFASMIEVPNVVPRSTPVTRT